MSMMGIQRADGLKFKLEIMAYILNEMIVSDMSKRSKVIMTYKTEVSTMKKTSHPWPATGVMLVDFSAPWCGPCKSQKPVLKEIEALYKDRAGVTEINIDDNRDLAAGMGIQSIPTLIVFKDGREIKRFVGLQSRSALSKAIDLALA